MTHLRWRDPDWRTGDDKRHLQHFVCAFGEPKRIISAEGVVTYHPRVWEYRVQALVQNDVRKCKAKRWVVRLGFDSLGLAGVGVAQRIDPGELYEVSLGAIATRIRRQHDGTLGDELLEDLMSAIGDHCADGGYSGEVKLTGIIHRNNYASKRMCARSQFAFEGDSTVAEDYEDWARMLPIPEPPLFDDEDLT